MFLLAEYQIWKWWICPLEQAILRCYSMSVYNTCLYNILSFLQIISVAEGAKAVEAKVIVATLPPSSLSSLLAWNTSGLNKY